MQIQVCTMKETGRKLFAQSSAYHELITDRDASYCSLMIQASLSFDKLKNKDNKQLALFKSQWCSNWEWENMLWRTHASMDYW